MINKLKLGFFKKTVVFWWMKILRDSHDKYRLLAAIMVGHSS